MCIETHGPEGTRLSRTKGRSAGACERTNDNPFPVGLDVQQMLERVCVAAYQLECTLRLLEETLTEAEFCRYLEVRLTAEVRFQVRDFTLRAALESILSSN